MTESTRHKLVHGPWRRILAGFLAVVAASTGGVCCVKQGHEKPHDTTMTSATIDRAVESPPSSVEIAMEAPDSAVSRALLEGYALGRPDELQALPTVLREVSGLTDVSTSEIACVQDEEGTVFIYDLREKTIKSRIRFGEPGDYEAITRVDNTFFVLRSDGMLFEIADYTSPSPNVSATALNLPTRDNEGLCYDPIEPRLLISPKSRLGKSDGDRQTQGLFAYSLTSRQLDTKPSVVLDLSQVMDGREKMRETKRGRKRVLPSRFLPSSVTVHPRTGDFFVISAVAHNLAVFNRQGQLRGQQPLDPELFPQPEGISFLPNLNLVIVSEGVEGSATLLRFRPRP